MLEWAGPSWKIFPRFDGGGLRPHRKRPIGYRFIRLCETDGPRWPMGAVRWHTRLRFATLGFLCACACFVCHACSRDPKNRFSQGHTPE